MNASLKIVTVLFGWLIATVIKAEISTGYYLGADLSYANQMEDCGATYRVNGVRRDPYQIFKQSGANMVRLRLWHDPTDWSQYGTIEDVKKGIRRAKAMGMAVLLVFHYSDTWADPGKQLVPKAWRAFVNDTERLSLALYDYTFSTLERLYADGLMPDIVQIGNEINPGILMEKPVGEYVDYLIDWQRNGQLLNSGIRAVRDFSKKTASDIGILLHVAQPEHTESWLSQATRVGIRDFDYIGLSYYKQWSNQSIADLGATINRLRHRFHPRRVIVVETAYPWTEGFYDSAHNILGKKSLEKGYPASLKGQKKYLVDMAQAVFENGGHGVLYWAPDWVSTDCDTGWGKGSHWENATFFDFNDNNELLPGIEFIAHAYRYPIKVVFEVSTTSPPGRRLYLKADFLDSETYLIRLKAQKNKYVYQTLLMPGRRISYQLYEATGGEKGRLNIVLPVTTAVVKDGGMLLEHSLP